MNKIFIIKKIHKSLYVYEDFGEESFFNYVSKLIVYLNGMSSQPVIFDTIVLLNGLKKNEDLKYKDVRSVIIGCMNNIDRRYMEGDFVC